MSVCGGGLNVRLDALSGRGIDELGREKWVSGCSKDAVACGGAGGMRRTASGSGGDGGEDADIQRLMPSSVGRSREGSAVGSCVSLDVAVLMSMAGSWRKTDLQMTGVNQILATFFGQEADPYF